MPRNTGYLAKSQFRSLVLSLVGIVMTSITFAEQAARKPDELATPAEMARASNADGHFALDLYKQLAETESGKNIFFSPFSISLALTMVAEGAVDQTLDQMAHALHLSKGDLAGIHRGQGGLQRSAVPVVAPELVEKIARLRAELKASNERTEALTNARSFAKARDNSATARDLANQINALVGQTSGYELRIANALWMEQSFPIEPNILSMLKPNYGTVLFPVDFKKNREPVRLHVNQWVAEQTNNRIQDLLAPQSISDQTRLVITNAVYFKGDWADPFEKSLTERKPFQLSSGRSLDLPTMHQWNRKTASYSAFESNGDVFPTPDTIPVDLKDDDASLYPDDKGHTMLSLDYQGGKMQMFFLVPQSATGLAELEKTLTYDMLQKWIGPTGPSYCPNLDPKIQTRSEVRVDETATIPGNGASVRRSGASFRRSTIRQTECVPTP